MSELAAEWIEAEIVDDPPPVVAPRTELDFVRLLSAKLPPVKTTGPDWFTYERGVWQPSTANKFLPAALAILPEQGRTVRKAKTLIEHMEATSQVPDGTLRGATMFDGEAVLVNCRNGIVQVTPAGFDLIPPGPQYSFARQCAANFTPGLPAPLFDRVLNEVLPDPADRELLILCAGNFLYPDARFETALVCYGEGGRGKSTIADPFSAALGAGLVSRLSMSQLCDPKSYSLPALRYVAVNLGTELTAQDIAESGNFKTIVSGEEIEVRPIYGSPFTMRTACKLWFLANSLPRFKHGTEAELRRTRFLRFDYQPPQKDVTLKARLAAETDGVFQIMLEGLRRLLSVSEIPLGGAESRAVHDRFKISNDPVGSFVAAHCQLDPAARVGTETLRDAFAEFATEHGLPEAVGTWFFRALYERFTALKEVRPRINDERRRMVQGLCLLPNSTPDFE